MSDEHTSMDSGAGGDSAGITYEPDLTAGPSEAPTPSTDTVPAPGPSAQAEPAPVLPYDVARENEQLTRQLNELRSQVAPIVERDQRAAIDARRKPPVSMERLQSGEATAQELLQFLDWKREQDLAAIADTANAAARRAASEATVRGQMNGTTLGDGRDYDTLRSRYLEPAYRVNPNLRQAIEILSPESPALGEMYVSAFLHARELYKGDDVKAIKAIFDAVGAATHATQDQSRKIQEATRRGAEQIARNSGGPGPQRRRVDSDALWRMSDAEFREFERQQAGS